MSDPERAARLIPGYARAGASMFPLHTPTERGAKLPCSCGHLECRNVGKHPRTRNGKDDATSDLGQIAEWLARWPDANWAMRPADGFIVLDVDPRNGGADTLADLEAEHGPLPATLTCRTGSGGWHYWLRHDGPTRGKLAQGIDIKTSAGYLVVPPSLHAAGDTYEWIEVGELAESPLWVRDKLAPPPRKTFKPRVERTDRDPLEHLIAWVLGAKEGERNSRLYWAACRAHGDGIDPGPLIAAAESLGTPFHEAAATVNSAAHAPAREDADVDRWRWRERATR